MAGNVTTKLKYYLHIDDCLDVFAVHGVGGFVGSLLNGIFADRNLIAFVSTQYMLSASVLTLGSGRRY